MNKQKQLSQYVVKQSIICFVIVLIFGGVYYFTGTMADDSAEKKTAAEGKVSSEQGQITSLTNQLDKSGVAEKKFLLLQATRDNEDFTSNVDTLKEWLRNAKTQYRLSNTFKLSITAAKPASNAEFNGLGYDVLEHPAMKLEFTSISDTHVFSFIDAFLRNTPGFIRIDSLSMKRVGDIDSNTVAQVKSGATPFVMETKMEFNWIGVNEKPATPAAAAAGGAK